MQGQAMVEGGRVTTHGRTDSLGEGPCLDALGSAHVVAVPRIRHDQRWPRYVPQVVQLGLRAQMAVKLGLDGNGTLGASTRTPRSARTSSPKPSRSQDCSPSTRIPPWAA